MKRLMMATVLAGAVSAAALQTSAAVTAKWTGGSGAWETAANWDIGAVPGPTTNVQFTTASKVSVNSSPTVQSMYVASSGNSGPQFTLGADKKLTVAGAVTNFNIVSYSGGAYSFGGNLIAGGKKDWETLKQATSAKRTSFLGGAVADIGGLVWVAGAEGCGLWVTGESFVTCKGYLDDGRRNYTRIEEKGVLLSEGNISIADCYPNASGSKYPEPFTVDGGIVTNKGALVIASKGNNAATQIPIILRNAAQWRQYGATTIGSSGSGNSLQVLSGSTFESSDNIIIAGNQKMNANRLVVDGDSTLSANALTVGGASAQTNLSVVVDGGSTLSVNGTLTVGGVGNKHFNHSVVVADSSTLSANALTVGGASYQYQHRVVVTNNASVSVSGACIFGYKWDDSALSLAVTDNSSFSANSMTWGEGGGAHSMTLAVTNSSLTVASDEVWLPHLTSCKDLVATFVGTAENPATGDFPGGLCIGAGKTGWIDSSKATRTVPTMLLISNATVTVGKVVDGTSSGDMRIGAYNVAGETDLATNRVVISGAKGCIVAKHRFVTTGAGAIEFHVPQGGYQNEYKCAIRPKQGLLANADILIDLSEVKPTGEWQEYVLVDATSDLTVNTAKISVVAPEKSRYKIVSTDKKLSVRVKDNCGLVVVFR